MNIKRIKEDDTYVYYVYDVKGSPINIRIDRNTKDVFLNVNDMYQTYGIDESIENVLGTDIGLDFINESEKNNHGFTPLFFCIIQAKHKGEKWTLLREDLIVKFLNKQ
jgi:hypothetical protein